MSNQDRVDGLRAELVDLERAAVGSTQMSAKVYTGKHTKLIAKRDQLLKFNETLNTLVTFGNRLAELTPMTDKEKLAIVNRCFQLASNASIDFEYELNVHNALRAGSYSGSLRNTKLADDLGKLEESGWLNASITTADMAEEYYGYVLHDIYGLDDDQEYLLPYGCVTLMTDTLMAKVNRNLSTDSMLAELLLHVDLRHPTLELNDNVISKIMKVWILQQDVERYFDDM